MLHHWPTVAKEKDEYQLDVFSNKETKMAVNNPQAFITKRTVKDLFARERSVQIQAHNLKSSA